MNVHAADAMWATLGFIFLVPLAMKKWSWQGSAAVAGMFLITDAILSTIHHWSMP